LDKDLKYTDGLNMLIDDVNKFTVSTLEKIALARTLVSDADIFILDSPYTRIDSSTAMIV
jgi:ABC-type Mn2+/Zn2+ transport system ATPase subunit